MKIAFIEKYREKLPLGKFMEPTSRHPGIFLFSIITMIVNGGTKDRMGHSYVIHEWLCHYKYIEIGYIKSKFATRTLKTSQICLVSLIIKYFRSYMNVSIILVLFEEVSLFNNKCSSSTKFWLILNKRVYQSSIFRDRPMLAKNVKTNNGMINNCISFRVTWDRGTSRSRSYPLWWNCHGRHVTDFYFGVGTSIFLYCSIRLFQRGSGLCY